MTSPPARAPRNTLSRDRIIAAAKKIADDEGLDAVTIRRIAAELGVKAMAVYHHVTNKDEILDELIDLVFSEVEAPAISGPWRDELARRCRSMREALRRHPWAVGLMETRGTPGPANLAGHEAVLGVLRAAGFSIPATAHAFAILDAFVYGFVLQETMLDIVEITEIAPDFAAAINPALFPHLTEMTTQHVMSDGYRFADSFEVGLTLTLDGIGRLLDPGELAAPE